MSPGDSREICDDKAIMRPVFRMVAWWCDARGQQTGKFRNDIDARNPARDIDEIHASFEFRRRPEAGGENPGRTGHPCAVADSDTLLGARSTIVLAEAQPGNTPDILISLAGGADLA